jgi:hypothetical protein
MNCNFHPVTMIKRSDMKLASVVIRLFITIFSIGCVVTAHASLGGDSASVETDRVHMKVNHAARLTPSSTGSYTVHEMTLSTGTFVRQYVSQTGVVFAVSWSGPFMPDLRQLLGPHFDTMVARQAKQNHASHRYLSQHESDLVVESGGHPRSFVGRAYLPSLLPDGVADKDIQ